MFGSLFKVALAPVDLAASAAADLVTLGGSINDKDAPYTAEAAERLMQNVKDAVSPENKNTDS